MIGIGTTVNGGFAEYCVVPEEQVYPISDALSFEAAAMAIAGKKSVVMLLNFQLSI